MKLTALASSLFWSFTGLATTLSLGGNEVGNGGDVVVCKAKEQIVSIQLLDFYEAKFKSNADIRTTLAKEEDILKEIVSKISIVDTKRGTLFKQRIETFFHQTHFLPDVKLSDISDSLHLILPNDCQLEQIAVLDKGQKDPKKKFIISKDVWDRLDPLNRAGLVMHEIVYEYFASLGEKKFNQGSSL